MYRNYRVQLWPGAGYLLSPGVTVEARDEEEALVLASINDPFAFFLYCDELDEQRYSQIENEDRFLYLDRSEYGHRNIFLCIENARIMEA